MTDTVPSMAWEDLRARLARSAADAGLAGELRALVPDATDDTPIG